MDLSNSSLSFEHILNTLSENKQKVYSESLRVTFYGTPAKEKSFGNFY
jgi:hypothetical protein